MFYYFLNRLQTSEIGLKPDLYGITEYLHTQWANVYRHVRVLAVFIKEVFVTANDVFKQLLFGATVGDEYNMLSRLIIYSSLI